MCIIDGHTRINRIFSERKYVSVRIFTPELNLPHFISARLYELGTIIEVKF